MITKMTVIPPLISQFFDSILLTYPARIGDDYTHLKEIFEFIEKKLAKKLAGTPNEKIKYDVLKKEFLDLYGQIKAKKENKEEIRENKTEEPFYFFKCTNRSNEELLRRLKYRSRQISYFFTRNEV